MRVIIFAGKKEKDIEYMKEFINDNDYVIGCDGGLASIFFLNIKPDVLIGDFDSIDFRILEQYDHVRRIEFKREKDFSDLEASFNHCFQFEPSEIIVFGALGGRIDHCLSNIELLKKYSNINTNIRFYDNYNEIFVVQKNVAIIKTKEYLSLLPASDECIVSLKGVMYELDNYKIEKDSTYTISNEITGNFAMLEVHSGKVLVIQSNTHNLS